MQNGIFMQNRIFQIRRWVYLNFLKWMQKWYSAIRYTLLSCITSQLSFLFLGRAVVVLATRPEVQPKASALVIVSSLRNANNSICFRELLFFFKALPLVDGHVRGIRRCASPVSLSRDAGRLTALMAVKISGKNVDSWESHRQWKGMKERVHHLGRSLTNKRGATSIYRLPRASNPAR